VAKKGSFGFIQEVSIETNKNINILNKTIIKQKGFKMKINIIELK
jgi:hypothetical protein